MKNQRRLRNNYLLDVKVSRVAGSARWQRNARLGAAIAAATVVLFLTGYGVAQGLKFGARKIFFENPRFAIHKISVQSDGALGEAQLLQLARVRAGQNLFGVNIAELKRDLELVPLISQAEVRRVLPHTLEIRVSERVPAAQLAPPSAAIRDTFWVDRSGVVFNALRLPDNSAANPVLPKRLPMIVGALMQDVRVGHAVESEQIRRALELIQAIESSTATTYIEVERIDVTRPRLLLVTTRNRATVAFDVDDLPQQVRRLVAILDWSMRRHRAVQTVDLTLGRNVPVTFLN
jgi:cell division septal protein FtsQ